MASRIHWNLSGLNHQGLPLPHAPIAQAFYALDCTEDTWVCQDTDEATILEFSTLSRYAYDTVVNTAAALSKQFPDAVLCLECLNEDEGWQQKILVQNGETEALKGYIAYPEPERIFYPPTR